MEHPFKVGERYRNRRGEYEVISLKGSKMVIRYSSGDVLKTTVEMQARIWRNIQAEETRKTAVRPPVSRSRRGRPRGIEFGGLQENDFKAGVAGTSWRARTGLGGLLAQRMSDTTRYYFQSYAIYRRAEVHIARPECYDQEIRWREAKFSFYLTAQRAHCGFYIEKNNGPMDDTWDWLRFRDALDSDAALRSKVETAMRQLELYWEVYVWDDGGLVAEVMTVQDGLVWKDRIKNTSENISWSDFVNRLHASEIEKWCDLYLGIYMDKNRAIDAGIHIVDPVTRVYRALLPLYEVSTRLTG